MDILRIGKMLQHITTILNIHCSFLPLIVKCAILGQQRHQSFHWATMGQARPQNIATTAFPHSLAMTVAVASHRDSRRHQPCQFWGECNIIVPDPDVFHCHQSILTGKENIIHIPYNVVWSIRYQCLVYV